MEPQPDMSRREKLAAKRYNEVVKFIASALNGLALAVFGLGFLRTFFEPDAVWPSGSTLVLVVAVPLVLELGALYLLKTVKLES